MTVTSASYTTNSIKVTISNELSSTNIISAVDTAITTLGWTQYDTVIAGSSTQINGVDNTYSPISTYVYRALCADNTYYKYLIIRWDNVKTLFYTSAAEDWTLATHTPVNETWSSTGLFPHGYDLKDCYILVSASQYHFMIWPWIRSSSGMWSAIMEFERVVAEDNTGVPCFAWTNSLMIGTPYGTNSALTTKGTTMFAFPRTADGNTGAAAANVYAPVTNRGMFPPNYPQGALGTFTDANNNALHLGSYYNMTYGWDSTKTTVSPLSADAITKSMPFGRAFNWGVSKPLGSGLDTTTVLGSVSGGWPDGTGTNTDYLILGMSGGPDNTSGTTGAYNLNISGRPAQLGYGTSTAQLYKPILIGVTAWIAASDGIRTYDTTNTSAGAATTLRYSNAAGVYDLVFDGLRTIYGSTSTGIVRIDTETFNSGTVALTNGSSYLSIDQLYVYAVSRTASTTPKCYVVSRWSTSDGSTGTGFALVSTYTTGTAISVSSGFGTPIPDYKGACFVFNTAGTNGTQAFRISSFTSATGAQLLNTLFGSFASANNYVPGMYMDYTSGRLFYIITGYPSSTYGTISELAPSTLGNAGIVSTFGTITGGTGYVSGTYTNVTLTLGSGPAPSTFPIVNITVTGGIVTAVTIVRGGIGVTNTTVFTVPNTRLGGSGSGFSIPVSALASPSSFNNFVVSISGSTAYTLSLLYPGDGGRGDLSLMPYRGMLNISSKKPGYSISGNVGYISRVILSSPASDGVGANTIPAGNTFNPSYLEDPTRLSSCINVPGGYASGMSTNSQSIVSTGYISATDSRIYYTKDLFQMNNVTGGNTGRLLLKA